MTTTAPTVPIQHHAVCGCCLLHHDRPLTTTIAACPTCGDPCSCEGCIADAESRKREGT